MRITFFHLLFYLQFSTFSSFIRRRIPGWSEGWGHLWFYFWLDIPCCASQVSTGSIRPSWDLLFCSCRFATSSHGWFTHAPNICSEHSSLSTSKNWTVPEATMVSRSLGFHFFLLVYDSCKEVVGLIYVRRVRTICTKQSCNLLNGSNFSFFLFL